MKIYQPENEDDSHFTLLRILKSKVLDKNLVRVPYCYVYISNFEIEKTLTRNVEKNCQERQSSLDPVR